MYGKQVKIGKIDESCKKFLFGSSKVAKNLRIEARKSEAQGVENGVAYKKMCRRRKCRVSL